VQSNVEAHCLLEHLLLPEKKENNCAHKTAVQCCAFWHSQLQFSKPQRAFARFNIWNLSENKSFILIIRIHSIRSFVVT
jgi:hypothetical protein